MATKRWNSNKVKMNGLGGNAASVDDIKDAGLWDTVQETPLVKGADGKTYLAHTLNNTCVAPPRMLIAFLENHLQKDGTVTIPKCLQPYMGGKEKLIPVK